MIEGECRSNEFGISDGRASAFAKREDQHASFILKFDEFDISDKRASAFAKCEDQHVSFIPKLDEFDISDKRPSAFAQQVEKMYNVKRKHVMFCFSVVLAESILTSYALVVRSARWTGL